MDDTARTYKDLALHIGGYFPLVHSGKVRDSFRMPDGPDGQKQRLVLVSDRVSIFDFVLANTIEGKGATLNAFNLAARALSRRTLSGFEDDLVAYGERLKGHLPDELHRDRQLLACAVLIKELPMVKVECVIRGHLTGNAYKKNLKGERVSGHDIGMPDMQEGTRLMPPLFTPTTKAEVGHDEDLDYREVEAEYPGIGEFSVRLYEAFYNYALGRGIVLADTKIEVGYYHKKPVPRQKHFILADEAFTPDSSRFWDADALDDAFIQKKMPPSLDKQILRNWGKAQGIDTLDPKNPADRERVRSMFAPQEVVDSMMQATASLFERLYGMSVAEFQLEYMQI